MTDQALEKLLKEDPDKILHTFFKKFMEPKFDAMHESLRSTIETLDRITDTVNRLNDKLDGHKFVPRIIK